MRIFGWQADTQGCGTIRLEVPLTELRERGHDTHWSTRWDEAWRDADVVIGQRVCNEAPTRLWREVHATKNRPLTVFELDDDLLNVHPSSEKAYAFFSRPEIRASLVGNLRLADRVVVSTDRLADRVRELHPSADVSVVPNTLPSWVLDLPSTARTDGIVTVGWGGSPTHAVDWEAVRRPLGRYLTYASGVELHTVGANHARRLKLYSTRHRHTPWFASTPAYWRAIDFHVGLCPLADHPFNEAKSAIKALEYAARGVPVVASDVGPYREFVRHGETGFLVREPEDWARYLRLLVTDHDLRLAMGRAAHTLARHHTVDLLADDLEIAYDPVPDPGWFTRRPADVTT